MSPSRHARRSRPTRPIPVLVAIATLLTTLLATTPAALAAPEDWPQYRGPHADGISTETGILTSWPESGPEIAWRVPLGSGFSGLAIVDGTIYTLYGRSGDEMLAAFDASNGEARWQLRLDSVRKDQFGDGPRSTPVVHKGRVYAVGAKGKLVAVDASSGEVVWRRDLVRELGGRIPTWGVSAQPLIDGPRLIFNVGGSKDGHAVVAFGLADGKTRWTAGTDAPGYSQPVIVEVGGVRQVVVFSATRLIAIEPESGKELWTVPWKTSYDVNAATPVVLPPDRLFVSSGYDTGAAMFRLTVAEGGEITPRELWRSRKFKSQFSSPVHHRGTIFGFDNKALKAIDAATGEDRWRTAGLGHGSLLLADDHLIVLGERGTLLVAEATPEAYRETARFKGFQGKHWTVPTLYDGNLYIRNENELLALRFRAP